MEQLDIKLYALSSTNLNVVNFIPNIDVSIKEKYIELSEGKHMQELLDWFVEDIKQDLKLMKFLKINAKNLPIIASLYKMSKALASLTRSKTSQEVFSGLGDLMVIAMHSVLKTGQFSVRLVGDITKIVGFDVMDVSRIDLVFEALKAKMTPHQPQSHLKF